MKEYLDTLQNWFFKPLWGIEETHYYKLASKIHRLTTSFETDFYNSPLDPYKLIWVSPERIQRTTSRPIHLPYERRIQQFGRVESGEWDVSDELILLPWRPDEFGENTWFVELLNAKQFEESLFFESAVKRFKGNSEWEDTAFYRAVVDGLQNENSPHPYAKNEHQFRSTLAGIDKLYESIQSSGVKPEEVVSNKPFLETVNDSILVDVGRDGELFFVEGRRRLTISKILNVDAVPIRILTRHRCWMEYRDEVYSGRRDNFHPDFQEFRTRL